MSIAGRPLIFGRDSHFAGNGFCIRIVMKTKPETFEISFSANETSIRWFADSFRSNHEQRMSRRSGSERGGAVRYCAEASLRCKSAKHLYLHINQEHDGIAFEIIKVMNALERF